MPGWLKRLAVIVVIIAGICAGATACTYLVIFYGHPGSDGPTPGSRERQEYQEAIPAEKHPNSQNTQRDTQGSAPIDRQQTPDHYSVATKTEEHGQWYASPDWWVAIFTGLLVVATGGLWIFTALLWRSTVRAVIEGGSALELAKQEFIASHRPRLRVQLVECNVPERGETAEADVTVVNVGDTPATITSVGATIFLRMLGGGAEEDRGIRPLPFSGEAIVVPGQQLVFSVSAKGPFTQDRARNIHIGKNELMLVGTIRYRDGNGVSRVTGFCRMFDRQQIRYARIQPEDPDADYEFEG